MTNASKTKSIGDLGPGDHLCCIYENDEQHREVLSTYMKLGLERNEKVFYIVDARTADTVIGYLGAAGLDPSPFLESGQLMILDVDEAYMKSGEFDPDGMIRMLDDETGKALEEGFDALRVTGEMTWALKGLPGSERLIEYESKLNRFFPGSRCLAICQYDKREFSPDILLSVLATHPMAVIGSEIYDNFYYVPTDQFLGPDPAGAVLGQWIEHIRERKRIVEELTGEKDLFETFFAESPIGVGLYDADGKMIRANPAGLRMMGISKEEDILGLGLFDNPNVPAGLLERLLAGEEVRAEVEFDFGKVARLRRFETWKSGIAYLYLILNPLGMDGGKPSGFLLQVQDVTERKHFEMELERANAELESYAHTVSHDLRGPLSSIQMAADMMTDVLENPLEGEKTTENLEELQGMMMRNAGRALELVDDLLKLAEAGTRPVDVERLDVSEVAWETIYELAPGMGVSVEATFEVGGLGRLTANRSQVYQLFSNLVRNALQHRDGDDFKIEIRLISEDGNSHRYLFRDNGPGVPDGMLKRVFVPFAKGRKEGSGIGLSIVDKIVRAYGGDVEVYNDGGANFEFTLFDADVVQA